MEGQIDIFDFIEKPKTQFERLFEKIKDPVLQCANCLCQYCANNVEEIWGKVKPEEIRESCFNCDECRTFTGQAGHREHLQENCNKFALSEYGAERNRKKFKVISGGKIVEAREFRCCMCPQTNDKSRICPAGPGKPEETLCDFTVIWTDARGWKYKVMGDLAGTFKGRYQDDKHNGDTGWKGMRQMERRKTFDQAQEDLNRYAKQKGWKLAGEMG